MIPHWVVARSRVSRVVHNEWLVARHSLHDFTMWTNTL